MIDSISIKIENIPAIIYGADLEKVYIYVHGKMGCKEEAAAFAEIACPKGYQVLSIDLPGHGERKSEMDSFVPWKVEVELQSVMKYAKVHWNQILLRATSIGAWFCMLAYPNENLTKSLFVSPVLDMEQLIKNMMQWASVTEKTLKERKVIPTNFGETLDWEYYQYVRKNPLVDWKSTTAILYAGKDNLTSRKTVDNFVLHFQSRLTVMEYGEHWFHTPEQLLALNKWERENC